MQEDLHSLQMQLVQRQLAEPGLALSPALLFGDLSPWAADATLMTMLKDVATGQGTTRSCMPLCKGVGFVRMLWLPNADATLMIILKDVATGQGITRPRIPQVQA